MRYGKHETWACKGRILKLREPSSERVEQHKGTAMSFDDMTWSLLDTQPSGMVQHDDKYSTCSSGKSFGDDNMFFFFFAPQRVFNFHFIPRCCSVPTTSALSHWVHHFYEWFGQRWTRGRTEVEIKSFFLVCWVHHFGHIKKEHRDISISSLCVHTHWNNTRLLFDIRLIMTRSSVRRRWRH